MPISLTTNIWVFSAGRGNAIFIKSGLHQGFIVDMGKGDSFAPADFLQRNLINSLESYNGKKIAQAVLSHPHVDHIAQCDKLDNNSPLSPALLTCPHDKSDASIEERIDWNRLGISDPEKIELIDKYKALYQSRRLPLQTIKFESTITIPNLEYGIYFVQPAICNSLHATDDNKYGNSLSILFYYRHGQNTILIPGDITPEALNHILEENTGSEKRYTVFERSHSDTHPNWHFQTEDQPSLSDLLSSRGLSILVAPHHGLESCYSPELMMALNDNKPQLNIISDRSIRRESDGDVDERYYSTDGASGLRVSIEGEMQLCRSLFTSEGRHILIVFSGTSIPRVYTNRDPLQLLEFAT